MIAAWWLQAAVISTALALTASALDTAFAALGRPRRWAWVAAMLATVMLTITGPFRPTFGAADVVSDQVASTVINPSPLATATAWFAALSLPDVALLLVVLWAVITTTAFAIGIVAYSRTLSRARRAPRTLLQGAQVRLSTDEGPMIVGLRDPEIVVPRSLLLQDPAAVRLVLAHEREHLAARDPWLLLGAALLVAILPGLPAIWWMRARLRLAIEIDCDQRVLVGRRDRVAAYGDLLLSLASRQLVTSPASLGLSLHPSILERRIIAMTTRPTRRWLPVLILPVAVGVFVACNAPLPTTEHEVTPTTELVLEPSITEEKTVPDQVALVRGVPVFDKVALDLSMSLPGVQDEEVRIVADSLYEVKVDDFSRPLLLKEVQGRPVQ